MNDLNKIKKQFKFYNITLLIFLSTIILFTMILYISWTIKYKEFKLDNHSTQLMIVLIHISAYNLFFIFNNLNYLICSLKKYTSKKELIIKIVIFILIYIFTNSFVVGLFFIYSSNLYILIILITFLMVSPNIYFILKYNKLKKA